MKRLGILGIFVVALVLGCSASRTNGAGGAGAKKGTGGTGAAASSASANGNGSGGSLATLNSGAGSSCATAGMTRTCCDTGTQTCVSSTEFHTWSECVDSKGTVLSCQSNSPCGPGEFGPSCTGSGGGAGGGDCAPGEFGPGCAGSGGGGGGGGCGPNGCDSGPPSLCMDPTINNEPEILLGYEPASGQSVPESGQIKVWVTDERPPFIAPGEQVDASTGAVTTPGDRTARAPDGYLFEPALYIAPATAESGGTPHFPQWIKGQYNNTVAAISGPPTYTLSQGAPIDAPPAGVLQKFTNEDIWNVSDLGLAPGTYIAEFVIHDGDRDRAVGCVTIVITP